MLTYQVYAPRSKHPSALLAEKISRLFDFNKRMHFNQPGDPGWLIYKKTLF